MMNCERIWTEVMQELCYIKELKNKGNLLCDLRIKEWCFRFSYYRSMGSVFFVTFSDRLDQYGQSSHIKPLSVLSPA